jgi:hypothetical protein
MNLSQSDKEYIERFIGNSVICRRDDGQIFNIRFADFLLKCVKECSSQFYLDLLQELKSDPTSNQPLTLALTMFEEFYNCKPMFYNYDSGFEIPNITEQLLFGRIFFIQALLLIRDSK